MVLSRMIKLMLLGRVSNQRSAGSKLRFLELQQIDGRPIQIVCNYARLEDQCSESVYQDFLHSTIRGDIYSKLSKALSCRANHCRLQRSPVQDKQRRAFIASHRASETARTLSTSLPYYALGSGDKNPQPPS